MVPRAEMTPKLKLLVGAVGFSTLVLFIRCVLFFHIQIH
jgi:hypothetical protein